MIKINLGLISLFLKDPHFGIGLVAENKTRDVT
jgi:hypothetical protein